MIFPKWAMVERTWRLRKRKHELFSIHQATGISSTENQPVTAKVSRPSGASTRRRPVRSTLQSTSMPQCIVKRILSAVRLHCVITSRCFPRESWRKPQNGKTWFYQWEDWVDWEAPAQKGFSLEEWAERTDRERGYL